MAEDILTEAEVILALANLKQGIEECRELKQCSYCKHLRIGAGR